MGSVLSLPVSGASSRYRLPLRRLWATAPLEAPLSPGPPACACLSLVIPLTWMALTTCGLGLQSPRPAGGRPWPAALTRPVLCLEAGTFEYIWKGSESGLAEEAWL